MSKPVELTAIETEYSANIYGWQDSDKNYTFIGDKLIVSSVNNFAPGSPYTPTCSLTIKEDVTGAACLAVENINTSGWSVLQLNSSTDGLSYVNLLAYGTGGYVQEVNANLPTKYADYTTHVWRTTGGTEKMRLDTSTGEFTIGDFVFDIDQIIGVSEDNYILTYNNSSGKITLEPPPVTTGKAIAMAMIFG